MKASVGLFLVMPAASPLVNGCFIVDIVAIGLRLYQNMWACVNHLLVVSHIYSIIFSDTWDDWTKYDEMAKELFGMG